MDPIVDEHVGHHQGKEQEHEEQVSLRGAFRVKHGQEGDEMAPRSDSSSSKCADKLSPLNLSLHSAIVQHCGDLGKVNKESRSEMTV